TFQNYYDGDQNVRLLERARTYLDNSGLGFCENFCEPVIDAYAERVELQGFTVEDKTAGSGEGHDTGATDDLADWLDTVWQTTCGDV
ncbi:hypothetical protein M1186_25535, partial [Salmonella enterica subsp. enterica serovar Minnesota]|uniref:hypothetical protein n=1 Tax=Salmonella enterica TaxID=28901 RepID=UPI0021B2BCB5